jgi:AAA domain-containing protein
VVAAHHQTLPPNTLKLRSEPVPLDNPAALDRLALDSELLFGRPLILFIFDTVAASLGNADENDTADVARIVRNTKGLIRRTGATALLVHHARRGEHRPRGASNWVNDTDWAYEIRRRGQEMRLEIRTHKVKEREFPPVLTVGAPVVTLPDDPDTTGLKLELIGEKRAASERPPRSRPGPALSGRQRAVFEQVAPHLTEPTRLADLLKVSGVERDPWNAVKDPGIKQGLYVSPERGLDVLGPVGRRLIDPSLASFPPDSAYTSTHTVFARQKTFSVH